MLEPGETVTVVGTARLDSHGGKKHLILGVGHEDGTAQIEVYDEEGTLKGAVTGGDSIDAEVALSWVMTTQSITPVMQAKRRGVR